MREYAACFNGSTQHWMVIARDPYDYGADYWFIFLPDVGRERDKAMTVADALSRGE